MQMLEVTSSSDATPKVFKWRILEQQRGKAADWVAPFAGCFCVGPSGMARIFSVDLLRKAALENLKADGTVA